MLKLLRSPNFAHTFDTLKKKYLGQSVGLGPRGVGNGNEDIYALRANLSYVSPKGFGEWRIVTTDRMRKDLQQLRRGDGKLFRAVWLKLR
jgi:hypothetical protein